MVTFRGTSANSVSENGNEIQTQGYSHGKGLLLKVFYFRKPEWINAVIVADDTFNVLQSAKFFATSA